LLAFWVDELALPPQSRIRGFLSGIEGSGIWEMFAGALSPVKEYGVGGFGSRAVHAVLRLREHTVMGPSEEGLGISQEAYTPPTP
jgi:hypothetical protein